MINIININDILFWHSESDEKTQEDKKTMVKGILIPELKFNQIIEIK